MSNGKPTDDFWQMAGAALIILALCLGQATCIAAQGVEDRTRSDRTAPKVAALSPRILGGSGRTNP